MQNCILLLVFGLASLCLSGQVSTNPFEITIRKGEDKVIDSSKVEVEEIVPVPETAPKIKETAVPAAIPEIQEETIENPINNESQEVEEGEVSFLEKQQLKIINDNPFNVSHIPLKRSSIIKEKTEKVAVEPIQKDKIIDEKVADTIIPERIKKIKSEKFLFWLLLIQMLLLTSLIGINQEFIGKIYRSITNDNFAKLVSRDYNGGYSALFVILYILFILSLSIFGYLCSKYFFNLHGLLNYMVVLSSIAGIYLVRHIFQGFISLVFPFKKPSNYYNFMIILFNCFLGLLLIPVNIIAAYGPSSLSSFGIYLGLGLFIILYLLRFLRGSLNAYNYIRKYVFHFFLYLCTCEFAPVFILVKFLSKSFFN